MTLSARRKIDRAKMAMAIYELAVSLGCTAETLPDPWRRLNVTLKTPRGLALTIKLDGDSHQPDTFVLSWHVASNCDTHLNPAHWGSAVNPYHFQKATDVHSDFDWLLKGLRQRLEACQSGEAYDDAREAAYVAKHGSLADRIARREASMAEWLRQADAAQAENA